MLCATVPSSNTLLVFLILTFGNHVSPKSTTSISIAQASAGTPILNNRQNQPKDVTMTVAVVSWNRRSEEALLMLKSCLVVSPNSPLRFIVFTDDEFIFKRQILFWKQNVNEFLQFEIHKLRYPINEEIDWASRENCWDNICQRIFLPELLPHIDSLIYLDTDCIFLSPVETLWKHFQEFNSTQIIGMAPDHETYKGSPYATYADHPFYGKSGLNSGVLLMNLTRMRAFRWDEKIRRVHHRWGYTNWHDQGYFNILFRIHPHRLYLLYCSANFCAQFCEHDPPDCTAAVRGGIQVLHGTGGDFHNGRYPSFTTVYNVTKEFRLGMNRTTAIFQPIIKSIKALINSSCADAIVASIKVNKWAN